MRILHSKQAGTAGGLLSAASPGVETGLSKPINSHPTIHGGGSAQPLGEWGFPYPGMQHSQEVSSPPGSRKAKANPCRGSFSHDLLGCWAPGIPPPQRKSKSHSRQTLWRNFFCLIILLEFSKMPQASAQLFLSRVPAATQSQGQPFLGCWAGLICREAKAELALGGSNNESFWALQSRKLDSLS